MSASCESRYRRALRWYPKRWRRQHEEAMLGVLLRNPEMIHEEQDDGCDHDLGQARLTLTGVANGGPPEEATLGQGLDGKAWVDALSNPASVAAKADWPGCMADAGYSMKDPLEDIHDPHGSTGTPAEIKQALADISCKRSTDYIARVNAENVRDAEQYLEQNRSALRASKAFNDNALKNANEVIAAG